MTREQKAAKVKEIEEILGSSKGMFIADFRGMSVAVISELRRRCRRSDVRLEVVKNTLLRRAARATGNAALVPYSKGPSALATSTVDEVAPARVIADFLREFRVPVIKGGAVGGQALSGEQVKALAALPPREVLLGNLLRVLQAPLASFVSVLQAPMRNLASVLDQVAKQKGSAG